MPLLVLLVFLLVVVAVWGGIAVAPAMWLLLLGVALILVLGFGPWPGRRV